ncbi:hypothetical protein HGRIS_000755 [Hohenbuehelia grisea]|uniref:Uncharacterized protein n=1 Tax=Hohenbuehelia grisea TaxID=104357 RepID=A0ABR3IPN2_9AGAR
MATSTFNLVQQFNGLPRKQKTPSGLYANNWHFDLRFVHLEPTPAHVLFIIHPESTYLHLEHLADGKPPSPDTAGSFFPSPLTRRRSP